MRLVKSFKIRAREVKLELAPRYTIREKTVESAVLDLLQAVASLQDKHPTVLMKVRHETSFVLITGTGGDINVDVTASDLAELRIRVAVTNPTLRTNPARVAPVEIARDLVNHLRRLGYEIMHVSIIVSFEKDFTGR